MKAANGTEQRLDLIKEFVNTLDYETGVDALATPDELAQWLADNELVDDLVEPTEDERATVLRVREAIRDLLAEHNAIEVDEAAAAKTLDEAAGAAQLGVHFRDGRMVVEPSADGALAGVGRIVATVADVMQTKEWDRLKACRDDHCRYVFYDESRNRSRAWCSMEVCGNREKQRSFRGRRHGH